MKKLIVNLIRHGESSYKGIFPDLTEEGKKQARRIAVELKNSISNEKVIIWMSPAQRAKGTVGIILRELGKNGIGILKRSTIPSLRAIKVYDKEFVFGLWTKAMARGESPDELYLNHEVFDGEKNDKVETRKQIERRMYRLINSLNLFFKGMFQGERIRIICITHFEMINPIITQIFREIVAPTPGENLEISFYNGTVQFSFREMKSGNYRFSPRVRRFYAV